MKVKHWMTIYEKKYRYQKSKKEDSELNLASLLDVLVIILFFLILNYNPTDLQINLIGKTQPASSTLTDFGHNAVTVQVNANKDFYVDGTMLGNLQSRDTKSKIVTSLKNSKTNQELFFKSINREPTASYDASTINIIFDAELDFEVVHQVMALSSSSGFTTFKLIVRAGGASEAH